MDKNERIRPRLLVSPAEIRESTKVFLLPHEVDLMHGLFWRLSEEHAEMADLLAEAMNQSSETYHDNAPADAARDEAEIIGWKALQLVPIARNYEVVDYLREDYSYVGIGSRVLIKMGAGSAPFYLEIAGAHLFGRESYVFEDGQGVTQEVTMTTYQSPLGSAIFGLPKGAAVKKDINGREVDITVLDFIHLGDPRVQ